jgi:hypothetical protein
MGIKPGLSQRIPQAAKAAAAATAVGSQRKSGLAWSFAGVFLRINKGEQNKPR